MMRHNQTTIILAGLFIALFAMLITAVATVEESTPSVELLYEAVPHLTAGPPTTTLPPIVYPEQADDSGFHGAIVELELAHPVTEPAPVVVVRTRGSAPAAGSAEIEAAIASAAAEFGLDVEEMRLIAHCESRFDNNAVSHTNDHGLFQHNGSYGAPRFEAVGATWEDRYDPLQNARAAAWYRVQLGRWGGTPGWVCAGIVGLY